MDELIEQLKDKIGTKAIGTMEDLIEEITGSLEFDILNDWFIVSLLEQFDNYDFVKERIGEMKSEVIRRAKDCCREQGKTDCSCVECRQWQDNGIN